MKKPTVVVALATLALVGPAAAIAAADPLSAVQADLAKLSSDVQTAQNAAVVALGKITTDAQKGDVAAVKDDVKALRDNRAALLAPLKGDRQQLKADLKAATDANVDPGDLTKLLQNTRAANKSARADVRNAIQNARDAIKALRNAAHATSM